MMLLDPPPYLPFMDARLGRPPGLMPLDSAEWFVLHADFADQMAQRDRLIAASRARVLATTPEAAEAEAELMQAVAAAVPALPGYAREGDGIRRPDGVTVPLDPADPLASAGRLVADDLCLLLPEPAAGEYRLAAAVLCFPSRWLLADKIGRPLTPIHGPVPDYDDDLARRVNRVFEALRVERPLYRVNWLVHATADLHLPSDLPDPRQAPDAPGWRLYLRTERQTLLRLPRTGAVVFGIKTSVSPVESLSPAQAAALRDAVAAYDPATVDYKGGPAAHRAALARLAEIACQGMGESASSALIEQSFT